MQADLNDEPALATLIISIATIIARSRLDVTTRQVAGSGASDLPDAGQDGGQRPSWVVKLAD